MGVTVLLYARAVNRLFHCPEVLVDGLWSIRCHFWSLCLARTLTRSPFTSSQRRGEGAGHDQRADQGRTGSSQGGQCEARWTEAGPGREVALEAQNGGEARVPPPESRMRGYVGAMPNEDDISHEETTDPLVANAHNFYNVEKWTARRHEELIASFTQAARYTSNRHFERRSSRLSRGPTPRIAMLWTICKTSCIGSLFERLPAGAACFGLIDAVACYVPRWTRNSCQQPRCCCGRANLGRFGFEQLRLL